MINLVFAIGINKIFPNKILPSIKTLTQSKHVIELIDGKGWFNSRNFFFLRHNIFDGANKNKKTL
jgi:hypothetical protein